MESLALTVPAAAIMGLVFGAGPCNITCLPYLGPVFLAREGGIGQAWRTIVPFSLGRLSGYGALGAVAGWAGYAATSWLEEGAAGVFLGIVTIALGLLLFTRSTKRGCTASRAPRAEQTIAPPRRRPEGLALPAGLFGMGAAMALNPCAPLGTVLLAAAATADPLAGLGLGLGFGAGAVLIPGLVFGVLVAHFGTQVRIHLERWRSALERSAGALLMLLGTTTALGWIQV